MVKRKVCILIGHRGVFGLGVWLTAIQNPEVGGTSLYN